MIILINLDTFPGAIPSTQNESARAYTNPFKVYYSCRHFRAFSDFLNHILSLHAQKPHIIFTYPFFLYLSILLITYIYDSNTEVYFKP